MHPPSFLRLKLFLPDQSGNRGGLRAKVNVLEIFLKIVKESIAWESRSGCATQLTQFTLIQHTSVFVLCWH